RGDLQMLGGGEGGGRGAHERKGGVDAPRGEGLRTRPADNIAAEDERSRVVNVDPAHDRKRRGVMQLPDMRRGGRGKADQLAGFEIGADRELTRRPGEPENFWIELLAQRRRLWKFALEFASCQIFGAGCHQEPRLPQLASP